MSGFLNDPGLFAIVVGVAGGILGSLCGVLGAMAGVLAPRGVGRSFVLGGFYVIVMIGGASFIAGIVALATSQHCFVWFFPMQIGIVLGVVCGVLIPTVKRRYREAEARRLDAEALRRGA